MKLKALLFDVDGTLADTEDQGHRPAFNAAFRKASLPWEWGVDLYGELLSVTGGKERIRHYATQYKAGREAVTAVDDLEALITQLHADKTCYFVDYVNTGRIPLRPGVQDLISDALEAGLVLAIVTTTSPENVSSLLNATLPDHLRDAFALIAAGDIVEAKKPAPDIYQYTLRELGLPASACLAIEDSENGLQASVGCGIATIATPNGYTVGQDFSAALAICPDLSSISVADLERIHAGQ